MKIILKNISMKFDDVIAVDKLNVTMEEGSLVSLLGPSGCGKSTTLFMLAGLYQPTSGQLFFGDQLVNNIPPEKREIGMVFQNYALYPHMTVLKNIMFPLKMEKVPKKIAMEKARDMASLVHIDHLLDRKPGQLSGGQQQRVAIARALVKKPKLLLLDEPLSNLDARLRLEMREEIKRIQQATGITTIFVTHDQEEALSISDKILLMKNGRFQQFSGPQDIYDHPKNEFVAQFLGNPPINLLPATLSGDRYTVQLTETGEVIQLPYPVSKEVKWNELLLVGIRPEDLYIEVDENKQGIGGKVLIVERIGRDNLVSFLIGERKVRAIVPLDASITQGQRVKFGLHPNRFHIFRETDGENLLTGKSLITSHQHSEEEVV
ncbi:ABC transporter ATP-binding protein [Virgibacillus sp. AGTR]|uniref:ABC transporter ATP-binding protein n=1 Tax=unclassified Virgibacillus TaxID=2620237 RepID=UPI0019653FFC|nr:MULTISPECIES: ABC transporter ATP-binding protein [unclassified Virgibacillus]MCC2249410.1 ABC transporter ATP-binding protein [Virgibacillus sp. AGTR]MDY7045028.1 ABC transporter ATP-binding protein [Virgibacillus sp. M23]QRZ18800.1 ABC transporter ATP-binding protein [Virgibacillus sp. AGTR]